VQHVRRFGKRRLSRSTAVRNPRDYAGSGRRRTVAHEGGCWVRVRLDSAEYGTHAHHALRPRRPLRSQRAVQTSVARSSTNDRQSGTRCVRRVDCLPESARGSHRVQTSVDVSVTGQQGHDRINKAVPVLPEPRLELEDPCSAPQDDGLGIERPSDGASPESDALCAAQVERVTPKHATSQQRRVAKPQPAKHRACGVDRGHDDACPEDGLPSENANESN
jgi:hypothetical protein